MIVLYHGSCQDGFASAWAIKKYFNTDSIEFVPVNYGEEPPYDKLKGRKAYIVDFSYKRDQMLKICELTTRTIIIDHHKTAQKELEGLEHQNLTLIFDMTKSGASLTWEHLNVGAFKIPWIIQYIQDRDLWAWELPNSKAINAAIRSYGYDFENMDYWASLPEPSDLLISEGSAILRYQDEIINTHVKNAVEVDFDGHKVLCVNSTTLISEIGQQLATSRPFGMSYFIRADGKKIYSLRSDNNGLDVSVIAKNHGGGGHKNAAGFEE